MIDQCFICWWNFSFFLKWKDFNLWTTNKEFSVIKCNKCWLEKINPVPDFKEISSFYPKKEYYSFNSPNESKSIFDKIINLWFKNKYIWLLLNRWKMGIPFTIKWNSFLDIWCWDWFIIKLMKKHNWETYGFEIWEKAFKENIYYDEKFEKIDFWTLKFDFIRISHVFEHLPDPIAFLNKLKTICRKNTIIDITLPNTRSFTAIIFWKYWSNRDIPRHLINYNISNLWTLLEKEWFKIVNKRFLLWFWLHWSLLYILKYKFSSKYIYNLLSNQFFSYIFLFVDFIFSLLYFWDHMWFRIKIK